MMSYSVDYLNNRIAHLENTNARRDAHVPDPEHYHFRVSASCPSSLKLYMRGGLIYVYRDSGNGRFITSTSIDLTDPVQMLT